MPGWGPPSYNVTVSDPGDGVDPEVPARTVDPIPFPPDPLGRWLAPQDGPGEEQPGAEDTDPTS